MLGTYTYILVYCYNNNTQKYICTYSTTSYSSINTTVNTTDVVRYILDVTSLMVAYGLPLSRLFVNKEDLVYTFWIWK